MSKVCNPDRFLPSQYLVRSMSRDRKRFDKVDQHISLIAVKPPTRVDSNVTKTKWLHVKKHFNPKQHQRIDVRYNANYVHREHGSK